MLIPSVPALNAGELRARVISDSGDGIAGVAVVSMPTQLTTTGSDGSFVLQKAADVIRFSLRGYRPTTKTLDQLTETPEVILQEDREALWSPPHCSSSFRSNVLKGDAMLFTLPQGVRVKRGSDIEYATADLRYKRHTLRLGWGPLWSYGVPTSKSYFADLKTLQERDVLYIPDVNATEYRGLRTDGTYWRWVGILGETVSYDRVDKEAADFFDRIIDTLCWSRR
jgi:hypothetical protein